MPKISERRSNQRRDDNVQSVLISRTYDFRDIEDILDMLGFNYNPVDITKDYYRIRQFNPGSFRIDPQYKTVNSSLLEGVKFVIEY